MFLKFDSTFDIVEYCSRRTNIIHLVWIFFDGRQRYYHYNLFFYSFQKKKNIVLVWRHTKIYLKNVLLSIKCLLTRFQNLSIHYFYTPYLIRYYPHLLFYYVIYVLAEFRGQCKRIGILNTGSGRFFFSLISPRDTASV